MSTLLTHEEYCAIAQNITYPVNPFINGEYVPPSSGNSMETINPATGEVITRVAACGPGDVDLTVDIARKTFEQGSWSRKHPAERKEIIIQLAKLIERDQTELAVLESSESGKPIIECLMTDLPETTKTLKWQAEAAETISYQITTVHANGTYISVRE